MLLPTRRISWYFDATLNPWWPQEVICGCVWGRHSRSKMAYRGARWSDPFASKTTRNERFAQMSKQEQLIEQKKREIQAKLEDQKKKETEEALKKLQGVSGNSRLGSGNKSNSQSGQHKGNRKPFWKRYVVRLETQITACCIIMSILVELNDASISLRSIYWMRHITRLGWPIVGNGSNA